MQPLGVICPDKPRRSKRRRNHEARSASVELRIEPAEREQWIRAAKATGYLSLSDWIRDRCNSAVAIGPLLASQRDTWNTPPEVLDPLAHLGPIGLDPCSNETSIVDAALRWTLPECDGLTLPWVGHGLVYVNPPYGEEIVAWIDKALREAEDHQVEQVLLVPARPDTRWFRSLARVASIGFWAGRLRFLGAATSAPFPSAIVYLGSRRDVFVSVFSPFCSLVT